ncbi:MAG TPA: hypothetical protein VKV33_00060 [Streptosporangiaceae bacterium]|nr:hypothetical protein [Streptosporangiaceae bacterium]
MRPVRGSWREAAAHLVASAALLEYKRRDDLERREAADGLSGLSQELGPYRDGLRRGRDADVLYPGAPRDPLIRIARLPHLVQAKWTEDILDEMARALRKNLPEITDEKTSRLRHLMNTAVRDCLVTGYEPPIPVVELPDPGDRRVLAPRSEPRPRSSRPEI